MRHRTSKLKYEHAMIPRLRKLLESIVDWPEIQGIIPARIRPTKGTKPGVELRVQYSTQSGLKCIARSGGAAQEVFFVSGNAAELQKKIELLPRTA